MSRIPTLVFAAAIAAAAAPANAQKAPSKWADTVAMELDRAVMSGDKAVMRNARALAERVATAFPEDGLILHYEGYALYREATLLLQEKANAFPQLERAKSILEQSLETHPLPETHVIISSIDGQLIGADPSRAMELGIAAQAASGKAMMTGADNPRVWLIRGENAIYTPEEYGGGLSLAKDMLAKAITLFAKDAPKPGDPAWGKAEAHVWLGQVYSKMGDNAKAAAEYQTALSLAPSFKWAKELANAAK